MELGGRDEGFDARDAEEHGAGFAVAGADAAVGEAVFLVEGEHVGGEGGGVVDACKG